MECLRDTDSRQGLGNFAWLYFFLVFSLPCSFAFAKQFSIQWQPVENAARYEIDLRKNGKTYLLDFVTAKHTVWSRSLPPGDYSYRIRAHDWSGEKGAWTEAQYACLPPEAPKLIYPMEGNNLVRTNPPQPTKFLWEKSEGTDGYLLTLKRGEETILQENISVLDFTLKEVPVGNYTWWVVATMNTSRSTKCQSASSEVNTFAVHDETQLAPGRFFPSFGLTQFSYSQTAVESVNMTALTLGMDAAVPFSVNAEAIAEGSVFVVPLSNLSTSKALRHLDLGAGLGYSFVKSKGFFLKADLTYQYETMLGSSKGYGFRNLMGVGLGITTSYDLTYLSTARIRLKSILFNDGSAFLTTSNQKISLGLIYDWSSTPKSRRYGVGFEVSRFRAKIGIDEGVATAANLFLSVGF